jgi:hypothetical protein
MNFTRLQLFLFDFFSFFLNFIALKCYTIQMIYTYFIISLFLFLHHKLYFFKNELLQKSFQWCDSQLELCIIYVLYCWEETKFYIISLLVRYFYFKINIISKHLLVQKHARYFFLSIATSHLVKPQKHCNNLQSKTEYID